MPTFNSIIELARTLQRSSRLLNDMFVKRKTLSVKYEDALETLDGDEGRLKYLIDYGLIMQTGDTLELDDTYLRFFEDVLSVNEDIDDASVNAYIGKVELAINSYLAADTAARRNQYLREVRHGFKSIENATRKNVVDLKRNVEQTYKQEPNFKIKSLRLHYFDDKAGLIKGLVARTEKLMDEQHIFFATASDIGLKQTLREVRDGLGESSHALIAISAQIIDYLNRIEYQSQLVRKIRQLKYMRDQLMIEESTDVRAVLSEKNDLWMEKKPRYVTRVSLDFLRNEDASLDILSDVRRRLQKKATVKQRIAGKIPQQYLLERQETSRMFDHEEIMNGFFAQGRDLFSYVWNYSFAQETDKESRLVLFLQLSSQYDRRLKFLSETRVLENIEYPLIYAK